MTKQSIAIIRKSEKEMEESSSSVKLEFQNTKLINLILVRKDLVDSSGDIKQYGSLQAELCFLEADKNPMLMT